MRNVSVGAFSTSSSAATSELLALLMTSLARLLTAGGLSCDEVVRSISNAIAAGTSTDHPQSAASLGQAQRDCMEILCIWRRDTEFLTEDGLPSPLQLEGCTGSFTRVCAKAQAVTDSNSLLETLKSFGAISVTSDGRVILETPTFLLSVEPGSTRLAFDGVLKQIAGFIRVLEHNLLDAESSKERRFERSCTVVVPEELLPVFERLVASRGQDFIDVLDEWLERHRTSSSKRNKYVEIGAGAYFVDLGSTKKTE